MLATAAAQLPEGAGWSYAVKWDGYRTLPIKDGPRVKLLSGNLKDATRLYPSVAREVARLLEQVADAGCPDAYLNELRAADREDRHVSSLACASERAYAPLASLS
jgi:ATP-dependent DNA ligase